jgi:hypothetical protein
MSGSGEPTVVTVDQVKALVATDLSDSDLEDVIAREEAWLARRIGALTGERTMLCYIAAPDLDMPLYLTRPMEPSQVRLLGNGTIVERADAHWTGPTVSVTFTPNDDLEVERVIIELVRIGVSTTPFESERIGEYSYSRGTGSAVRSAALLRDDLVKELTPLRGPRTMRLQSSLKAPRIGAIS